MGRQLAVALSPDAEAAFLAFIAETAPVRIFRDMAASIGGLEVKAFSDWPQPNATFLIWNTGFDWAPQFYTSPENDRAPWARVANHTIGPVLEYSRSLHSLGRSAGRIYWPKVLPHPNPCAYDVEAFERWYDEIVRWLKKAGTRGTSDQGTTYFIGTKAT